MATYYVNSGAGGAATGADWTNAYLTLGPAVTAATTDGDIIKVHYAHIESVGTTLSWVFTANVSVISVNKDSSDAPTVMEGTGYFRTSSTAVTFNCVDRRTYFYGLTVELNNAATRTFTLGGGDGSHAEYESCTFRIMSGSSNASFFGIGTSDVQAYVKLRNCTLGFNAANNYVNVVSRLDVVGGGIEAVGTAPTTFISWGGVDPSGSQANFIGFNAAHLGSGTLVNSSNASAAIARFSQCKLGSGYVMLATQTNLNRSSAEVYVFDCASGDTHGLFAYANPMGSVVSDTGIYVTAGAAAQSWKIVTTANCSFYTPFETPWFGYYNTVTTSIAPYVEILRDGSTTAYQDDEVWLDVMAKTTSGSTQSSLTTDRMTLLGTPANHAAGAGLGSWTGESGTAWSGKMVMASLTPAEVGHIQARIVVGEPSITVYADPQIRT